MNDNDIQRALKVAAAVAKNQESFKGIPVSRIDTHSLRAGGANARIHLGATEFLHEGDVHSHENKVQLCQRRGGRAEGHHKEMHQQFEQLGNEFEKREWQQPRFLATSSTNAMHLPNTALHACGSPTVMVGG